MPRILRKLKIDEISSVSRGAGDSCKIVLMKRDDTAKKERSLDHDAWLRRWRLERVRKASPRVLLRLRPQAAAAEYRGGDAAAC